MKKRNALVILLPIAILSVVALFIAMILLSISPFGVTTMFIESGDKNFIIDICLRNAFCIMAVTVIVIIAQLIIYNALGERVTKYRNKISLVLTVIFIAAMVFATLLPISQYEHNYIELNNVNKLGDEQKYLPYYDEFMEEGGMDGYIDEYKTSESEYQCVFYDSAGLKDMRYICEFFQSNSKWLCAIFKAEDLSYPTADAVHGEKDGTEYTAYYERDEVSEDYWFNDFVLIIEQDNTVFRFTVYNTEDVINENTEALINTALEQYNMLIES